MRDKPIGVLDSGVGGLTIWKEIVKELPNESTIYIADSKNCPYGSKSKKEIYGLAKRLVQFLLQREVKLIVLACNTITVSCLDKLRKDFPQVPIVGTVPVVKTASEVSKSKKIGVLSTLRTSKSKYQKELIIKYARDCLVINIGTNKLVPFVEKGMLNDKGLKKVLKEILLPFQKADVDVIALGCSHFPFLKKEMQAILGSKVQILDSAGAISRQVKRVLVNNDDLSSKESSVHRLYVTVKRKNYLETIKSLAGNKVERIDFVLRQIKVL